MDLYEANQQLHDVLSQEVARNQCHERNLRLKDKQLLEREQDLVRKDTTIEKLNSEIQNFEKVIKKLRQDLRQAQKENKEKCIHIKECEKIIVELRDSVTKLKNRIQELYSN
jgi:predicted  nucleic acid-binding Zn-ribbon protein